VEATGRGMEVTGQTLERGQRMKNTPLTVPADSYNATTTSIPKPFPRLVILREEVMAL
jgi:hypothetical protein